MPDAKLPRSIKASEMQLGDTVTPEHNDGHRSAFDACIVSGISKSPYGNKIFKLFRPYGTTVDFSCGSDDGCYVICYTGIEHYAIFADSGGTWTLWNRQELK